MIAARIAIVSALLAQSFALMGMYNQKTNKVVEKTGKVPALSSYFSKNIFYNPQTAEEVEEWVSRGESIDQCQEDKTPLIDAINMRNFSVFRALIKYGADVNKPTNSTFFGLTPFAVACLRQEIRIAKYLLFFGATPKFHNQLQPTSDPDLKKIISKPLPLQRADIYEFFTLQEKLDVDKLVEEKYWVDVEKSLVRTSAKNIYVDIHAKRQFPFDLVIVTKQ